MGKDNDRRGQLTPEQVTRLLRGVRPTIPDKTQGKETPSSKADFIKTMIEEIPGVISVARIRGRGLRPLRCYTATTEQIKTVQIKLAQNHLDREAEITEAAKGVPQERIAVWLKENAIIIALRPKDEYDGVFQSVLENRIRAIHNYHKKMHKA